jgi:hypothetical protein
MFPPSGWLAGDAVQVPLRLVAIVPDRPSPLPASLRADPVSRQHLIDFQPDQGVASALWLSAISILLFRDIQVKAQVWAGPAENC